MFPDSDSASPLPDAFFHQLLGKITALEELKVTLYALWRLEHMDGPFRALAEADFDPRDLGLAPEQVHAGLEAAVGRGSLLRSMHAGRALYFLNSPQGLRAAQAYADAGWPAAVDLASAPLERPNVFALYEQNIGPLTPMIADALKDAEASYPGGWVIEAIELAVKNNKRSWKYAEAILKRWKEEGRGEKQIGRDDQASRQHDVEEQLKRFRGGTG